MDALFIMARADGSIDICYVYGTDDDMVVQNISVLNLILLAAKRSTL